jgi:hypothetical protein
MATNLKLKPRHAEDEEDRWTPRTQPGGIYCSPRCGCKCTKAAFDGAHRAARALAEKLGDGWAPRVWENGGWHWEVAKGPCATERSDGGGVIVRKCRHTGRFSAEFRSALTGTKTVTQFFADADTAEDAIGTVRQDARTFISRLEADLASSI